MMDKKKKTIIGIASGVAVLVAALIVAISLLSEKKVKDFINLQENIDTVKTVENFNDFVKENPENIHMNKAENYIVDRLHKEVESFREKVKTRNFSDRDFACLYDLAQALKKCYAAPKVMKSSVAKWLFKYTEWREANQTFTLKMGKEKVAIASYKNMKKPYFRTLTVRIDGRTSLHAGAGDLPGYQIGRDENGHIHGWWQTVNEEIKIDDKLIFSAIVKDCRGNNLLKKDEFTLGEFDYTFYPGLSGFDDKHTPEGAVYNKYNDLILSCNYPEDDVLKDDNAGLKFKIPDVSVSSVPFYKWLEKHPYPTK